MAKPVEFKGNIIIEMDQQLIEAKMTVNRETDLVWDEAAVTKLLSESGIKETSAIEQAFELIRKFDHSKDPSRTHVIAKGQPPEPSMPETFVWEQGLSLPPELLELSKTIIKEAGKPVIVQIHIEKVKKEKKQLIKGSFLSKSHEESVIVEENQAVKEKILVDPHMEHVFYVEKSQELATITLPSAGKPGRDLQGRALAPPASPKFIFHIGNHLEKKQNKVLASCGGFLRVGKNWADLVPFEKHHWNLSFSSDQTNVFLNLTSGHAQAPPIIVEEILKKATNEGISQDHLLSETEVQTLVSNAIAHHQSLSNQTLMKNQDAFYEIVMNSDQTKAVLNIQKALGQGKPLVLKELGQHLKEITYKGFNFESAKTHIMEFINSQQVELNGYLLAQGKSASRGKDKVLEFLVDFMGQEEWQELKNRTKSQPQLWKSIPKLDILSLDQVQKAVTVSANQQLAILKQPENGLGEAGIDLYGQTISAIPGNDPPLVLLSNVRRNLNSFEAIHSGLFEVAEIQGVHYFRVRFYHDAQVEINTSEDGMEAFITLQQGQGSGKMLDRTMIDEALKRKNITYGLQGKRIQEALQRAVDGEKVSHFMIARGNPPLNDIEKRLAFLVQVQKDAQGQRLAQVKEGQDVAEYWTPTNDSPDGTDVFGEAISSQTTDEQTLNISEDFLVVTEETKKKIIANKNGELIFDGKNLTLQTQLTIPYMNAQSGSVKFAGDVLVEGDVSSGLYLMAGSVQIKGQVHGALVSSETNIHISHGVKGETKAVLRAKKHIAVDFAEKSTVMAVGDFYIQRSILGCNVRCNGKIVQKTPKEGVMGGFIKVRGGMDVMNLGSPNKITTTVSFGQDYLIENQIEAEVKETDKLRQSIINLDDLMKKLNSAFNKDKLDNARKKKVLLMKMLEKRGLKLIHLRDKFELHCPSELIVRENIYPGVFIESHGRLYEIKSKKNSLKIVFNQNTGHIEEHPLGHNFT